MRTDPRHRVRASTAAHLRVGIIFRCIVLVCGLVSCTTQVHHRDPRAAALAPAETAKIRCLVPRDENANFALTIVGLDGQDVPSADGLRPGHQGIDTSPGRHKVAVRVNTAARLNALLQTYHWEVGTFLLTFDASPGKVYLVKGRAWPPGALGRGSPAQAKAWLEEAIGGAVVAEDTLVAE
jgi:hypothetical protein